MSSIPNLKCPPTIQLASGKYFNFLDVANSPMLPEDIAHALSKVCRFAGHMLGDDIYSVAQHCVLGSYRAADPVKFEVLMHDGAEFVMGDVTTPLKQLLPDFKGYEKTVEHEMRRRYMLPLDMSDDAKLVDLRMAATEKRDLMPGDPDGHRWTIIEGIEPYGLIIKPWQPVVARNAWLNRFEELWPTHQARHDLADLNISHYRLAPQEPEDA